MQSKHAFIFLLLASAAVLLFLLTVFLSVELLSRTEPYLSPVKSAPIKKVVNAPEFITVHNGSNLDIVELDATGQVVRTVYASSAQEKTAAFDLFAVPQTTYSGQIFVQSAEDESGSVLIIHPLDVETGKISAAVIKTPSNSATVSPEQNRVAVITLATTPNIVAYDIATGVALASWSLKENERLGQDNARTYSGDGVHWVSNDCFEHPVWTDEGMETRTFCVADTK